MSTHERPARRPASAFISYARADGEDFARRLRSRIEREHPDIFLWQDRAEMRGGVGWWQQIEAALAQVSFLVIVMTPAALGSDLTRKEWRLARQQGVCVFPVKAVADEAIDWEAIPKWIGTTHFYDLEREWDTLIRHLKSPCVQNRVPFMAPDLPEHFVPRPQEYEALLARVLDPTRQDPIAVTTSLQGAGGFGKTTLAKALCHDDEVITAYVDGILWVTLGETADLRRELTRLYRALSGEAPEFLDAEEAAQHLAQRLVERRCLIVIDDVWKRAHLEPFLRGAEKCTRLITTRRLDMVADLDAPVKVDEMRDAEAVDLLIASLKEKPADTTAFRTLAARLGEWPLLLRLAGSVMQSRLARGEPLPKALEHVNRALDRKGVAAFDRGDAESRNDAVGKAIGVSLDLLAPEERRRCFELAVFAEDVEIPLGAATALWQLDEFDAEDCARRLTDLALIELDLGRNIVELHDVMRSFYAAQLADAPAAHSRLLASWGDPLALTDSFALRWLCHHMAGAGQAEALRARLLDYRWLEHKLGAAGINAVLGDFRLTPADPVLAAVEQALRQAAHILGHQDANWSGADQLASQLLARLLHRSEPEIAQLCSDAAAGRSRERELWLRPISPSLRAPSGLLRTMAGHEEAIATLVLLPDGRLASGSWDGTIRLWNLATGQADLTLEGHSAGVLALTVLPDGRLASASADQTIKVWNPAAGRIEEILEAGDQVRALTPLPGERLASIADDEFIKLWDLASGGIAATLNGHRMRVSGIAMLPDGRLASSSFDGTLKLWNLATGRADVTLSGHVLPVTALTLLPDGRLASSRLGGEVKLWNLATGAAETLAGHGGFVNALVPLPDGHLASLPLYGSVELYDLRTGMAEAILGEAGGQARALVPLPEGRLATAWKDGTIKLWDLATVKSEPLSESSENDAGLLHVQALAALQDGRFASAAMNGRITLWNGATGNAEATLRGHEKWVNALVLLPHGRLASGSDDMTIKLWNLASMEPEVLLTGHDERVTTLLPLPDGRLASGSDDMTIKLWNLATGEAEATLEGHDEPVRALAVLPNGRLASGSFDGNIRLWDLPTAKLAAVLERQARERISCLGVLHDGRLVSGSLDHNVKLWNPATAQTEVPRQVHRGAIRGLKVLPRGRFATVSDDRAIRLWSERDGQWSIDMAFVAEAEITALAFLEHDGMLAAGDASGRVHFFKLEGLAQNEP